MNSLKVINDNLKSLLKHPNDKISVHITPSGSSTITKIETSELNATLREYYKKDGTPGKKTLTLKEKTS